VKHLPNLRLSPLGCVPQRGRRPRLIVDLSFYDVNQETVKTAPPEAMQFGRALDRLLYRIRHANPAHGPVYANKIDISDGFYRIPLDGNTAPNLAIILPALPGEPPLVAIPLSLPMGWVESPPLFCAFTETIADLSNHRYHRRHAPPHRLDAIADTPPEAPALSRASFQRSDIESGIDIPVRQGLLKKSGRPGPAQPRAGPALPRAGLVKKSGRSGPAQPRAG